MCFEHIEDKNANNCPFSGCKSKINQTELISSRNSFQQSNSKMDSLKNTLVQHLEAMSVRIDSRTVEIAVKSYPDSLQHQLSYCIRDLEKQSALSNQSNENVGSLLSSKVIDDKFNEEKNAIEKEPTLKSSSATTIENKQIESKLEKESILKQSDGKSPTSKKRSSKKLTSTDETKLNESKQLNDATPLTPIIKNPLQKKIINTENKQNEVKQDTNEINPSSATSKRIFATKKKDESKQEVESKKVDEINQISLISTEENKPVELKQEINSTNQLSTSIVVNQSNSTLHPQQIVRNNNDETKENTSDLTLKDEEYARKIQAEMDEENSFVNIFFILIDSQDNGR